jgi:protein transport protein SEC31
MVRIRAIPRTATFAWSSSTLSPQIVTGTKAGAVDADFSNETVLEIWDLDLDNVNASTELKPSGSLAVDSR